MGSVQNTTPYAKLNARTPSRNPLSIFYFSCTQLCRLGHGRIGLVGAALLARIYGCTAEEALFRVQMYHDARVSVKMSNRAYSCPQTVEQVTQVREVVSRGEGMYGSLITRGEDATIVYDVKRRVGMPQLKKGRLIPIDHEAIWDAEIGAEKEMSDGELEEAVTNPRHHCNATPGHGVSAREPEYEFEMKSKVTLVDRPVQPNLRPMTLTEELREHDDDHLDILRNQFVGKEGEIYVISKGFIPRSKKEAKGGGEGGDNV